jgi:hypothetical protein
VAQRHDAAVADPDISNSLSVMIDDAGAFDQKVEWCGHMAGCPRVIAFTAVGLALPEHGPLI